MSTALDFQPRPGGCERLAAKAESRSGAIALGFASDSTGDEAPEWIRRSMMMWCAQRPHITAKYNVWKDVGGVYDTTILQTTNVPSTVVARDTFTRTDAELIGDTPDVGPVWTSEGTAQGSWATNGSAAVAQADSSPGPAVLNHGNRGDVTITLAGVTIDSATSKSGNLQIGVFHNANDQMFGYLNINSSGVAAFGIGGQARGTYYQVATGSGSPIPTSATTTFDMALTVEGAVATFTVNGSSVSGRIPAPVLTAIDPATKAYMQTTAPTMAGIAVGEITVTARPGMQNVRIYNGAMAGSRLDYQVARLHMMYPEELDLMVLSSCHNYVWADAKQYEVEINRAVANIRRWQPLVPLALTSQNPEFPASSGAPWHNARNAAIAGIAARLGASYIPVVEAFRALPDGGLSMVRADGVHPSGPSDAADPANGSFFWATVAAAWLETITHTPSWSPFGMTFTVDPGAARAGDGVGVPAANAAVYLRVRDPALVAAIGLVCTASSGTISIGVYRNVGRGRDAVPGTLIATTGSIACPSTGYSEVALPSSVVVQAGDWLAISADNTTAKFASALTTQTDWGLGKGRQYRQSSAHPLPSTPASLTATVGNTIMLTGG